jgi:LacI family transcriptional regulator
MAPRSRPTIREVAARAGVSHQTVSRVINGSERVNPDTRERVERAISELGYQPNAIARSMARGRTLTLACIAPNLTDYTFANIIEGAEIEARSQGFFVLIASAPNEKNFNVLYEQLLGSRRAEGLLVITPYIDRQHTGLHLNVPTVYVGADPRQDHISLVTLNDTAAGLLATQHLIELGHQRIAHIIGPLIEDSAQNRLEGYHSALSTAGVHPDPRLIVEGDWSATSGYEAVHQLFDQKVSFSAIFAQNDRMAIGAIRALRETGIKVPEDVSVVGFDDMPLASYFDPPLTTIKQDTFRMGSEAARLLIRLIEHPEEEKTLIYLPGELVIRQSTATVPSIGDKEVPVK